MKRRVKILLVAIPLLLLGTAAILVVANPEIVVSLMRLIQSNPRTPNSPYSELQGRTVRTQPYRASFDIPSAWLEPIPVSGEPTKSLFLSEQDLSELYSISGGDAEDAELIDKILPFEECAAHFGSRGWGNHLWNDLQGRVYISESKPEEIGATIETVGLKKAQSLFEEASIKSEPHGKWTRHTFDIVDAPTHFILGKNLDFFVRPHGTKTVVFVFLHADPFTNEINGILDSFQ